MRKLDVYWKSNKDWYHRDQITLCCVVNEDAPEEAKKSYENYLKQVHELSQRDCL